MGVRITHLPTGLSAESRVHREQARNKKDAFARLSDRLVALVRRSVQVENTGNVAVVIRTYHEPDDRVVDHRTGKRASWKEIVTKGDLDKLK